MDCSSHNMSGLFAQLGLEDSQKSIESFISKHRGIPQETALHQASFWSDTQAQFLKDAISEDSDWAEIVDSLDAQLR
ncbi:DUF2789 domain-containing protein [Thalassotalea ganghwensis]